MRKEGGLGMKWVGGGGGGRRRKDGKGGRAENEGGKDDWRNYNP